MTKNILGSLNLTFALSICVVAVLCSCDGSTKYPPLNNSDDSLSINWNKPDSGYWVERKSGRVWMTNARRSDETMMKGTGFVDTEDPEYRYGMSATPRPADIPKR